MPGIPAPALFIIRAVSPKHQKPEDENYIVLTKLNDGNLTKSPKGLNGIFAVRCFLEENGIETKQIAVAVEELSHKRETKVSTCWWKPNSVAGPKLRLIA
jgi:hypothetical protein